MEELGRDLSGLFSAQVGGYARLLSTLRIGLTLLTRCSQPVRFRRAFVYKGDMPQKRISPQSESRWTLKPLVAVALVAAVAGAAWYAYGVWRDLAGGLAYEPRAAIDASGFTTVRSYITPWQPNASLAEVRDAFDGAGYRAVERIDRELANPNLSLFERIDSMFNKTLLLNYEGEPQKAYDVLEEIRSLVESDVVYAEKYLYTVIYLQGVTALRRGENENCIMCRGESSCISADLRRPRYTRYPRARGWRSSTSPSISSSFPTTWSARGCSTSPT